MTSTEKISTEKISTEKTSTEKISTKENSTKTTWGDQEEQINKVGENNKKYAEWWITNLTKKASSIMLIVKLSNENTHGKKVWAKNAVRVKLYNKLNGYMEEHSLYDILVYMYNQNSKNTFLEKKSDEKCQVNVTGTYYISSDLYDHLSKLWKECMSSK